jgi:hypothetical protein
MRLAGGRSSDPAELDTGKGCGSAGNRAYLRRRGSRRGSLRVWNPIVDGESG